MVADGERPKRISGLELEPSEGGFMIYEPARDRIHYLNATAALILEFCDGERTACAVAELVQEAYGLPEPPSAAVEQALAQLRNEGLLA